MSIQNTATIPILLNTYGNQIFSKPDVDLAVISNVDNDGRKALIELTNDGSLAATNLSLTIETPKKISSITNEFSITVKLENLTGHNEEFNERKSYTYLKIH